MLLNVERNSFKLKQKFTISRGSRDSAEVLTVSIRDGEFIGLGEWQFKCNIITIYWYFIKYLLKIPVNFRLLCSITTLLNHH